MGTKDKIEQIGAKVNVFPGMIVDCELGIKQRLQSHLANVFQGDTEPVDLLFNIKVDGKTLYELRSDIAHERIDSLSEEQRRVISMRGWDVERIARTYLLKILKTITGKAGEGLSLCQTAQQ